MDLNKSKNPARTHVSFRIFSFNLSPEEVTTNLVVTPDYTHHPGDYPRNDPKFSPYKHGMWLLKSKLSEMEPLESHLEMLLSIFGPKFSYISSLAKTATVDFYCVLYSQNGFQLSPQILKKISDLGATFGVVIYNDDYALTASDVFTENL